MKTINRTLYATTATIYRVDKETDKTVTETVTLNGKATEKDFIKSAPLVYKVEDMKAEEAGKYTLDISVFMEHAEQGLKPTTRTRYVTATIKECFADVLYVDTETNAVDILSVNVTGCATEKQMLKKANAIEENATVKAVAVKEIHNSENHYFMLESEFMKYATFVPVEK